MVIVWKLMMMVCSFTYLVVILSVPCDFEEIILFAEPTNNVAPKKIGAEFGGWRVAYVNNGTVAFLTCQVTGFPVPRFL